MLKILLKNFIKILIIYYLNLTKFGLFYYNKCLDKSLPGRESDCSILKELCNIPIYFNLMTKECPKTCGRCNYLINKKLCFDNIGLNGISECSKYKERCNDTIWGTFMKKECPLSCGMCKQFNYNNILIKENKTKIINKKQKDKTKPKIIKKSQRIRLLNFPTLINSINPKIRQCDDFYDYVCDGYRKNEAIEIIATMQGQRSHFHRNADKARKLMIDLLLNLKIYPKLKNNLLFTKLIEYFNSCINLNERKNDKITQILLNKLINLRQKMGSKYIINTEWIEENHPIFPIETVYGYSNPIPFTFSIYKFDIIYFTTPTTGIYSNNNMISIYQLTLHNRIINHNSIDKMRRILDKLAEQRPKEMIELLPLGLPIWEAIDKWIDNVIKLSKKLNKIIEEYYSPNSGIFEIKTLNEIYSIYTPSVDWKLILNKYNSDINENTTVLVKCKKCFIDVYNLINQNSDLIKSYLEMDIIYKYLNAFGTEFKGLTWNYENIPIEEYCLLRTATHFGMAADRLFLDFFFEEKTKNDVMNLIIKVKEQFRQLLISEDWMDEQTRKRAINKLDMMKAYSGYFDEFKDTKRIIKENDCFNIINQNLMSFGEIEIAASFCTNKRYTQQIILIDDNNIMLHKITYIGQMFDSNAFYSFLQNIFIVLAGYLFYPIYDIEMPLPMKLGGVGVVIGHEITHGYDNNGRKYNEIGKLENWWNKNTEIEFERRTKCFIKQYNNFLVRIGEKSLQPVNGRFTLSENLADAGGLKSSLWALKDYIKIKNNQLEDPKVVIHGLEYLTDEQLFFITYAFGFCSVEYTNTAKQLLFNDNHSPSKARVNVALTNFQEFMDAFKCQPGDKMFNKLEERCILW